MKRVNLLCLFGAALLVLVAGCPENLPPNVPGVPVGPAAVAPRDTARFRMASVDPEGYSVSFRCAWGNGDTSGWGLWAPDGETTELAYAWPQVGRYDITAQARDVQEVLSNWSEPFSMLVGNPPRVPTRPDGPANGWIDSTCSYTVVATDIDGDDIRYAFDWGEGAVETTAFHETGEFVTLGHVWTVPDSYDVRVMALDRPGLSSDWSTVLRVAIRDPLGPGVVKWVYAVGGEVQSAPALDAAGRVYFGCGDSAMYCLNPDSTLAWRFATGSWITSSPAIGSDGSVYFGSFDGNLYALSETGTELWRFSTGDEVSSSPALASDGTIYVGSGDGNLYAVNPDGSERWRFATGDMVVSSPAVGADGRVYFGSQDSSVYALDPDGNLKWSYPTGAWVQGSPAIGFDGTVYIASFDGNLYAFNPDGTLKWRTDVGEWVYSSPAIGSDGNVYVGSDEGFLYALYPDGSIIWRFGVSGPVASSPAIDSDGIVYFGAGNRLYAVNPLGQGRIEWFVRTYGPVMSSPVIGPDGAIYVGSDDGALYAVRGSGKLDNGPWPRFRHDARNTGRVTAW